MKRASIPYTWILGSVGQGINPKYDIAFGRKILSSFSGLDSKFDEKTMRSRIEREFSQRNAFFSNAAQAFERGDKHKAHLHSIRGRQHDTAAKALVFESSRHIFWKNNETRDLTQEVDLHGLQVLEAMAILAAMLQTGKPKGQYNVITGIGRNSQNNESRITNAVIRFCYLRSYQFTINAQNRGLIIIDIPRADRHRLD